MAAKTKKYRYVNEWVVPTRSTFRYCVNVDYNKTEYFRNCTPLTCDPYCRCGKYGEVIFEKEIDIKSIVNAVCKNSSRKRIYDFDIEDGITDIFRYCVDRLCRIHKLYDGNNWEARIVNGYYGEEIEGIYPVNSSEIIKDIQYFHSLADNDRVNSILLKEYGYVLENLEDPQWYEEEVNIEDIYVPNSYYKMKENAYKKQDVDSLPFLCACNDYRLVDGYHRYYAAKEEGLETVRILNAE